MSLKRAPKKHKFGSNLVSPGTVPIEYRTVPGSKVIPRAGISRREAEKTTLYKSKERPKTAKKELDRKQKNSQNHILKNPFRGFPHGAGTPQKRNKNPCMDLKSSKLYRSFLGAAFRSRPPDPPLARRMRRYAARGLQSAPHAGSR